MKNAYTLFELRIRRGVLLACKTYLNVLVLGFTQDCFVFYVSNLHVYVVFVIESRVYKYLSLDKFYVNGTVMQIEEALLNDGLRVLKIFYTHSNYL